MKQYDVKCPKCGAENKDLYLEETDGWYICEHCGLQSKVAGFERPHKIPVFTGTQLAKLLVTK